MSKTFYRERARIVRAFRKMGAVSLRTNGGHEHWALCGAVIPLPTSQREFQVGLALRIARSVESAWRVARGDYERLLLSA
jgi:hypothetical protein